MPSSLAEVAGELERVLRPPFVAGRSKGSLSPTVVDRRWKQLKGPIVLDYEGR